MLSKRLKQPVRSLWAMPAFRSPPIRHSRYVLLDQQSRGTAIHPEGISGTLRSVLRPGCDMCCIHGPTPNDGLLGPLRVERTKYYSGCMWCCRLCWECCCLSIHAAHTRETSPELMASWTHGTLSVDRDFFRPPSFLVRSMVALH